MDQAGDDRWQQTACILCSINCGIEVRLDGRRFERIRGDKAHPGSQGYTCEKALRLDHYQNGGKRLTSPLRRRADGTFEEIDWDTAIAEVAERFATIRDTHGGASILYYGGGGQGNHLGGAYSGSTRRALGSVYSSNALAQEKTGEFWVDGRLFGRQDCHTAPDFEHAEVALFLGKNPWQSHGFPRARTILKAIANDPDRTLVVLDPRRTETADLAIGSGGYHLQVRPGTDAFALAALLGVVVAGGPRRHRVPRPAHAPAPTRCSPSSPPSRSTTTRAIAGLDRDLVRTVARRIAGASSVAAFEDLGIQQAPHSTLSSYLDKLLYLLTGNFAKPGAHEPPHPPGGPVPPQPGRSDRPHQPRRWPPHHRRPGAVERDPRRDPRRSPGPVPRRCSSRAPTPPTRWPTARRMREALDALDLVVVIDVALTETARHRRLRAARGLAVREVGGHLLHPRVRRTTCSTCGAPIVEPLPGTAARAGDPPPPGAGARGGRATTTWRRSARPRPRGGPRSRRRSSRRRPPTRSSARWRRSCSSRPSARPCPTAPRRPPLLWGAAHRCALTYPDAVRRAGFDGEGLEPGEKLFDAILAGRSGVVFSIDDDEDTWRRIATRRRAGAAGHPRAARRAAPPAPTSRSPSPTTSTRSSSRPASAARPPPTPSSATRPGARRTCTARCGSARPTPTGSGWSTAPDASVTTKRGSVVATVEVTDTHAARPRDACPTASASPRRWTAVGSW